MTDDVSALVQEMNKKIGSLNEYLQETDVDPIATLDVHETDVDRVVATARQHRQHVDMIDLPSYTDARAHSLLHEILGLFDQLIILTTEGSDDAVVQS